MKNLVYLLMVVLIVCTGSFPAFALPIAARPEYDCSNMTDIPTIECEALVAFYNSTNGDGWTNSTNWLITNTPGNWYGVTVASEHVTVLNLGSNNLSGSLPAQLDDLTV